MRELRSGPRHAEKRLPALRRGVVGSMAILVALAIAVLGFGGAAARIPLADETTPLTPPNINSGLPSLPFPVTPQVFAKNAGQVSSPKSATTVNQAIQIAFAPNSNTTERDGGRTVTVTRAYIFPVSPNNSPNQFGYFLPVYVKTLAFGGIPTTLTLNARSHLDAAGLPTWFFLELKTVGAEGFENPFITGSLDLSISDVKVDGVPVNVGSCHSATPATFRADAIYWPDLQHRPPPPVGNEVPYFSVFSGGQLLGNLNIPAFTGCQNGSENLDPLFNSVVSGSQNTLRLTATGVGGYTNCVNPTYSLPYCGSLLPLPLPTNTQVH